MDNSEIVIDRPKGTAHPKYPDFIYKVDYGYLKNTSSMDGAGIDVWVGTGNKRIDACNLSLSSTLANNCLMCSKLKRNKK